MNPVFQGKNFSFKLNRRTYIMGVLNVTPDSFFDGGRWLVPEKALEQAVSMQNSGADIIDLGGQSTRPGHITVSPETEIERILPVLTLLKKHINIPVSIDTYYSEVAKICLENGAEIINDVSGIVSSQMAEVIGAHNAGWIIMHTGMEREPKELPKSMQEMMRLYGTPFPEKTPVQIVEEVRTFFAESAALTAWHGIPKESICFDIGIGFGKDRKHDLTLIRNLNIVKTEGYGLLTGASRKRIVGTLSNETDPSRMLPGTIALHTAAISKGADFIRVHDVAEAVQAAKVADAVFREGIL